MDYNFKNIESRWQKYWKSTDAYKVYNPSDEDHAKPKCYVLDMFPYPSGAGLHVGHPLGYIAGDIYARYKRLKGFNVLHPMGYDSFGLPAEQYAIETGQHPAVTTEKNIKTFRQQLDNIGFCFDWSREVRTSDAKYYKWTQWIFLEIFNSWYDRKENKARKIQELINIFDKEGNPYNGLRETKVNFTADEWRNFTEAQQREILMEYRLAYSAFGEVNWCEALGTVLANDEVVNGVSERGGHPVVKKKMRQWYLRITEYAERLLQGLDTVDFSEPMKEIQRNWIGKSEGAEIEFALNTTSAPPGDGDNGGSKILHEVISVYTTRPDTIFGVDFLVLAPEHPLVKQITTEEQFKEVEKYLEYVQSRSERERLAEVKQITGAFTGAYAVNPLSQREVPVWIAEYVLAGYGTGAIMGVPCGDQRDFNFANYFHIPITNIIGEFFDGTEANPTKDAILTNSNYLNGMLMSDAFENVLNEIEDLKCGKVKVNYKMRDAGFSRQRYWGEPFPIIYKNGVAFAVDVNELPVKLPHVESYSPGPEGEGPLANIKEWVLIPNPSAQVEKGAPEPATKGTSNVPKYKVSAPSLYELAKQNRKEYTDAEDALWQVLRNNQFGVKFRRQHPVDCYIADFICLQKALIIEVDGGYHKDPEQKKYDQERTQKLEEYGFRQIRFTNEEVLNNNNSVKKKIIESLQAASTPLTTGGEGPGVRETNTMPGYAGSSWYFLRYADPHNNKEFASKKATDYWNQVDVYVGGTEHAVGHLLYSRMWTKILFDLGYISFDEPYKKLVNQGMIQGSSRFVYRIKGKNAFVSSSLKDKYETDKLHVDVNIVDGVELDIDQFKKWKNVDFKDAEFILEDGKYVCGIEIEKMSKSKYNTVNPDVLIEKYGADTFRMYEMFLGPVEQSKPWDTKGIEGVHRFLRKLWRLFFDDAKGKVWNEEKPFDIELKILHKTIKKIEEDTERFSYNTAVSAFMVCVNELTDLKCHKKEILQQVIILLAPYAPHIAEELWHKLGNTSTILDAAFPKLEEKYLIESSKAYPVSINGKLRTTIEMSLTAEQSEVEKTVLQNDVVQKWLEGKQPKKIIFVKGKMINVVI
ncbi:hypothetical protein BH09BAC2_BH09BAC2_01960 [soil metagenome]